MTISPASIMALLQQIKNVLLTLVAFGIVVLAFGWLLPKLGVSIVRLPSASPTELVYAAGLVWLLR